MSVWSLKTKVVVIKKCVVDNYCDILLEQYILDVRWYIAILQGSQYKLSQYIQVSVFQYPCILNNCIAIHNASNIYYCIANIVPINTLHCGQSLQYVVRTIYSWQSLSVLLSIVDPVCKTGGKSPVRKPDRQQNEIEVKISCIWIEGFYIPVWRCFSLEFPNPTNRLDGVLQTICQHRTLQNAQLIPTHPFNWGRYKPRLSRWRAKAGKGSCLVSRSACISWVGFFCRTMSFTLIIRSRIKWCLMSMCFIPGCCL